MDILLMLTTIFITDKDSTMNIFVHKFASIFQIISLEYISRRGVQTHHIIITEY